MHARDKQRVKLGNDGMNSVMHGDCLRVMRIMPAKSIDLIYLDPPFNSGKNWGEFDDRWKWDEYLAFMRARLRQCHRVLKSTGTIYLHCDPNISHYLKVMMDSIFGRANFRNEITWKRSHNHSDAKKFGALTDRILFYGHPSKFNPQRVPYSAKYIAESFRHDDGDGRGRYRVDNLSPPGGRGPVFEFHGHTRPWVMTKTNLKALEKDGRIYIPNRGQRIPARKRYLAETSGRVVGDIWTDISPVGSSANERTGYPTQKPVALLERIIKASSNPGDVVLDPFCGSGTTLVAAQKLGRKWIGIDANKRACELARERLA